jgi:hypothetical protein
MPLRLRRAADQFPRARWEPSNEHLVIMSGETVIGSLKKQTGGTLGDRWAWSITCVLPDPGESPRNGWAAAGRPLRRGPPERLGLDGFEHNGRVGTCRDDDWRGARVCGARSDRAAALYSVGSMTLTMMQPCASAAKLRGGGPILDNGIDAMVSTGPRHLEPSSATHRK